MFAGTVNMQRCIYLPTFCHGKSQNWTHWKSGSNYNEIRYFLDSSIGLFITQRLSAKFNEKHLQMAASVHETLNEL